MLRDAVDSSGWVRVPVRSGRAGEVRCGPDSGCGVPGGRMSAPVTEQPSPATADGGGAAARLTAADRRAQLNLVELAAAAAEQHEVCRRPLAMLSTDPDTHETKYVPAPCKSTLECVCPACAARARAVRIQQCREGWHIEEEP